MEQPGSFDDFRASLGAPEPPSQWPVPLKALWWDARGDWHLAHELVDGSEGDTGCWVHAYLHRKEGDQANAGYWYRRAGRPFPSGALPAEMEAIVSQLLKP